MCIRDSIYTSADPVLQIAAHEDIIPLDELYRICEYARSITLERPALLGRIIAVSYTHLDVYKRQMIFWLRE